MVHIGNGSKIKNSNICSGQLILDKEIIVNGKKIPEPPCGGQNISIINDKVFDDGYEYKDGEWVKTFSGIWHKYFRAIMYMRKNNPLINFINGISKHFASAVFGIEFIGIYIWSDIFNNHQVDSLGFLIVSMWLTKFLFDGENEG